ncbi:hypothetical protein GF386_00065 [Candidatus Pacearchaeota archaeon]|nr:hypothetical protein [Candidatus Pacearchaeota archaeon]MBD3282673.1 hypothetical protein [Candidatus Pacearchaeota archaeon]
MAFKKIIKITLIFLVGFLSANLINFYLIYGLEAPLLNLSSNSSPYDFIKEDQIIIEDDKIIINIEDASIGRYAPTGSMRPVLDYGSNGIRVKPDSEEDVHIGDIISFRKDGILIIHRVVEKGIDKNGVYFITKGDNNTAVDKKVRFKDIEYITVGILW